MNQSFVYHYVDVPQFVGPFTCWWIFGLSPVFWNKASVNIHVQVFLCVFANTLSFLWSKQILGIRAAGRCMFNVVRNCQTVLQIVVPSYLNIHLMIIRMASMSILVIVKNLGRLSDCYRMELILLRLASLALCHLPLFCFSTTLVYAYFTHSHTIELLAHPQLSQT